VGGVGENKKKKTNKVGWGGGFGKAPFSPPPPPPEAARIT